MPGGVPHSAPEADSDFEGLAARMWTFAARSMPEHVLTLAVGSPLAARVPDSGLLWHPGYRSRHAVRLCLSGLSEVVSAVAIGVAKLLWRPSLFEYALYGSHDGALLVVPSVLGREVPHGAFVTNYISSKPQDAVLAVGPVGTCGSLARPVRVSRWSTIRIALRLAGAGFSACLRVKGAALEKTLLLEVWLSWALGLRWLLAFATRIALEEVLVGDRFSQVGCIHEMNAAARAVWRVAHAKGLRTCTVQHASVSRAKLWYFAFAEEVAAGVVLPDLFYVYSPTVADLLEPYYPEADIRLGCGQRYAQWRDSEAALSGQGDSFLFVGSLAVFDNEVVIGAILRLAGPAAGSGTRLRLRMHPAAETRRSLARRLRRAVAAGSIELSTGHSLADDIAQSRVVVGMSSTVLEEAILLGCPAIQLLDSDFLEYVDIAGIEGGAKVNHTELSFELLNQMSTAHVDGRELRERMGAGYPVVTYERLFKS